jgi:hypothetical protein
MNLRPCLADGGNPSKTELSYDIVFEHSSRAYRFKEVCERRVGDPYWHLVGMFEHEEVE